MKIIFRHLCVATLFLAMNTIAEAQTENLIIPSDPSTGMYTYKGEVSNSEGSLQDFKNRCQHWISGYYSNTGITPTDIESNYQSISFKSYFYLNPGDEASDIAETEKVQFTFYINCKNGSYSYEISDFRWVKAFYYPIEKWAMEKNPKTAAIFKEYLMQTDAEITDMLISFRQAMALPTGEGATATW